MVRRLRSNHPHANHICHPPDLLPLFSLSGPWANCHLHSQHNSHIVINTNDIPVILLTLWSLLSPGLGNHFIRCEYMRAWALSIARWSHSNGASSNNFWPVKRNFRCACMDLQPAEWGSHLGSVLSLLVTCKLPSVKGCDNPRHAAP